MSTPSLATPGRAQGPSPDSTRAQFKGCLIAGLEEILDKMAFMVFEESGPGVPTDAEPYAYSCRIGFQGKVKGALQAFFTRRTADELARNLIGIRNEDTLRDGTRDDALKELANILAGRALTLLDPEVPFALDLPSAPPVSEPPPPLPPTFQIEGMLNETDPCRIVVHLQD
ncbi:MAG TPA: chemotaxis protein CheX [bacterium]|nr:chemotaxis protein CheX [bacterium]